MIALDVYRQALLVAFPSVADAELTAALNKGKSTFPHFVIDHGLGPMWHQRTGDDRFQTSRRTAEVRYLAQTHALEEIDAALDSHGIDYVVIKGVANRSLLYENPAVRACHDIDLLVRPDQRVRAASAINAAGFRPRPNLKNIGHELEFRRDFVGVDLHWGLLREGRLRVDPTEDMLARRHKQNGIWMLDSNDAFYLLLVHPAFAKRIAGWEMGLHRVADIILWMQTHSFDPQAVCQRLTNHGVRTAAWATLLWVGLLADTYESSVIKEMQAALHPGRLRRAWLTYWLKSDLSQRMSNAHLASLIAFSLFLHDRPTDALRALAARYRGYRRQRADIQAFQELFGQQTPID